MDSNLDGDLVAVVEEIDLINNEFPRVDTHELSNLKMVDVDGSHSSICCPVTDYILILPKPFDNDS